MGRLCRGYDERDQLLRIIRRDGRFVAGSQGQPVHHPAVKQLRELEEQLTRLESLCGFTPSDRTRLGLAEVKRQTALQEFLASS
jgi:P27 family predicted phage terminase small subunit